MASKKEKKDQQLPSTGLQLGKISPKTKNQTELFKSYDTYDHILAYGSAGTGKAQPNYCIVHTPSGWRKIGDLTPGDKIYAYNGDICNVKSVHPQGKKEIFKVTFRDDRSTECVGDHLWEIHHWNWPVPRILNTYELKNLFDSNSHLLKGISIRKVVHPEINDIEYIINPYVLGVILGDGCTVSGSCGITSKDEFIIEKIKSLLPEELQIKIKKNREIDYRISSKYIKGVKRKNIISEYINELGLNCKSIFKFIPEIYKQGSLKQKLQLLQGLIDTDGYVDKGGTLYFYSSSKRLAYDVVDLVRSIGGEAKIKEYISSYNGKKFGSAYNVHIRYRNKHDLVSLPRKQDRFSEKDQYSDCLLKIKSVESLNKFEESTCISIDHPSHLYVTNDYIVTHNTFISLYLALNNVFNNPEKYQQVLILRSVVPTRDVGFLPGSLKEKSQEYEVPYQEICNELFGRGDAYEILKNKGIIKFSSTTILRGITFRNSIVIVDEVQNLTDHEINSVITRCGENTKLLLIGDSNQLDLNPRKEETGFYKMVEIFEYMGSVKIIKFTYNDIVRSDFVKEYIIARDKFFRQKNNGNKFTADSAPEFLTMDFKPDVTITDHYGVQCQ